MEGFEEIVREFLVESYENLDQLDRDLVALEQEPGSRDLLQSIFRTIHTIKGTSGFLAFNKLEALTHAGEGLLAKLRDGGLEFTRERADGLLELVDAVRTILAAIETTGTEGDGDYTALTAKLSALQELPAEDAAGETPSAAHPAHAANSVVADSPADAGRSEAGAAALAAGSETPAPGAAAAAAGSETPASGAAAAAATPPAAGAGNPDQPPEATPAKARGRRPPKLPAVKPEEPRVPLLGEVLKEQAAVDDADLAVARLEQELGDTRPIGEILVEHGQVTSEQVRAALAAQAEAKASTTPHTVAETSLRVDVTLLDTLMRLVGELVLTRNQIVATAATQSDSVIARAAQRLNLLVTELQEGVMKTRMQPIDTVFSKLPRVVRDLGLACGKQVRLEIEGRDTELDKTILEAIKDPLVHAVRNAIDHGIEAPEVRRERGKPTEGRLVLRAYHEGGQVNIEITDDGAGIDPQRVAERAIQAGFDAEHVRRMSQRELINLIFVPGLSTAETVTNVSGRGVGMDVVRANVERIGGTVDVTSELGVGTTLRIKIPLTLAIIPALTVECRGERYAIPQVNLDELVSLEGDQASRGVEFLSDAPVFRLRGNLIPLVWLDHILGLGRPPRPGDPLPEIVSIVVLQAEGRRFGLVVDRILNTEEIVVKPLSRKLKEIGAYAGATIMGDGRVCLILDVRALARRAHVVQDADHHAATASADDAAHRIGGPEALLVVAVGHRRIGIPLSMVTRLEEIDAAQIEHVGRRPVVQYRGHYLPLARLSDLLGEAASDGERLTVVVYTQGRRSVGLVVDTVIDIGTETPGSRGDLTAPGVTGVVVVDGRVTELLDMEEAIRAADPQFFEAVAASDAADVSAYDDYDTALAGAGEGAAGGDR
jgi:two-component system chemotaxis sensor kinase CheA